MNVELLLQVAKYVEDAAALGIHAIQAVRNGKAREVSDIIPETLRTTMARQRAEAEALAKFGSLP